MQHSLLLKISILLLILALRISCRSLLFNSPTQESNSVEDDDDIELLSLQFQNNDAIEDDDVSVDSVEERQYHARSISDSNNGGSSTTADAHLTLIEFLQKAIDHGWRPKFKHYYPATRFGRHRR